MRSSKLYVLVDKGLSRAQRMVQSCHAVAAHCLTIGDWPNETIVLLGVSQVSAWERLLLQSGHRVAVYADPYYGETPRALAVSSTKKLEKQFSRLPLL